jgi:hypothetical protein
VAFQMNKSSSQDMTSVSWASGPHGDVSTASLATEARRDARHGVETLFRRHVVLSPQHSAAAEGQIIVIDSLTSKISMYSMSSAEHPNVTPTMPSQDVQVVAETPLSATKKTSTLPWKQRASLKRQEQAAQIPEHWRLNPTPSPLPRSTLEFIDKSDLLTPREHQITSTLSTSRLLSQIASKEITCLEVTTAFCKRAAIAQQLTGCCTEMFFDRALKQAEELDRYMAETGQVVGPLHGLPVSLKDSADVEGIDSSIGKMKSSK